MAASVLFAALGGSGLMIAIFLSRRNHRGFSDFFDVKLVVRLNSLEISLSVVVAAVVVVGRRLFSIPFLCLGTTTMIKTS